MGMNKLASSPWGSRKTGTSPAIIQSVLSTLGRIDRWILGLGGDTGIFSEWGEGGVKVHSSVERVESGHCGASDILME